jgi:hypothetical protein
MSPFRRPTPFVLGALLCFSALPVQAIAQALVPFVPDPHTPGLHLLPENYGGYSGDFLRGGLGLVKPLPEKEPLLEPAAAWTLSAWVHVTPGGPAAVAIGGLGLPSDEDARLFVLADGRFALRLGANPLLSSDVSPAINDKGEEGDWHFLAATYSDGAVRFFVDGKEAAHGTLHAGSVRPDLELCCSLQATATGRSPEDGSWLPHPTCMPRPPPSPRLVSTRRHGCRLSFLALCSPA